jgi:predicted TIM-barrel fold metal-dependent hydrolase
MDRRTFVSTASIATVAWAAPSLGIQAKEKEMLPIVDTHQHLWDLEKFKLPWLGGAPEIYKHTYMTKEYAAAAQGLNIAQAVYMEVDVDPSQQVAEAEQLIDICRSRQGVTTGAVISGRPASDAFAEYMARFKTNPIIKGVRQVLHVPETKPGYCLEPNFVRGVKVLGDMGKSYDFCMRPGELADGAKLAQQCPETRFIVDHCGNADPKAFRKSTGDAASVKPDHDVDSWKRDMSALAKHKNVMCKISGIVVRAPQGWDANDLAPIVNFCLDEFGPDRVLFGSDWPVCLATATLRQWVEALQQIISNRPAADQRKLLHDNAVRFYGLS